MPPISHPLSSMPLQPEYYWGALFREVQKRGLLGDSKTFVDLEPRYAPALIRARFAALGAPEAISDVALQTFVTHYFAVSPAHGPVSGSESTSAPKASLPHAATLREHIAGLWQTLYRPAAVNIPLGSSRIGLPGAVIVPGGRFNECYYWDSYFTMLGLAHQGHHEWVREMVDNFAWLIKTFGHIPNGTRYYYLSRSQPPYFSEMLALLARTEGDAAYSRYLPHLEREHAFWMDTNEAPRCVHLPNASLVNRYWDAQTSPRPESWREDTQLAQGMTAPAAQALWRHLRAGAESGWDFSSRWLAAPGELATICTTDIAPIDLHCQLYHLEASLAQAHARAGNQVRAEYFATLAEQRQQAVDAVFWDPHLDAYGDILWRTAEPTQQLSAACLYPLYHGLASRAKAKATATTVREQLMASGGLMSTPVESGQQWDAPNGWAPLNWIAVVGLKRYGEDKLAKEIASRWVCCNARYFARHRALMEKYNVLDETTAGGGEYPAQDGFGWTNGVLLALFELYPELEEMADDITRKAIQPAPSF